MKRITVLTLILGAALVLIPIVELRAQQQRRNRGNYGNYGNNPADPSQTGDTGQGQGRNSRNSRFSGLGVQPRTDALSAPVVAATGPAATQSAGAPAPMAFVEPPRPGKPLPGDYEILSRKSIFDKERRVRLPGSPFDRPRGPEIYPAPVAKAPGVPILVGVLIGDDDYIAYIEDPDTSKLWPLAAGDNLPLDYGTVRQVNIDDIEIVKDGSTPRHILIGQNLKGETPILPPTDSYSSPSSSSSSSSSGIAPATLPAAVGDMTIEQRMKLRRQQQLGQ